MLAENGVEKLKELIYNTLSSGKSKSPVPGQNIGLRNWVSIGKMLLLKVYCS